MGEVRELQGEVESHADRVAIDGSPLALYRRSRGRYRRVAAIEGSDILGALLIAR